MPNLEQDHGNCNCYIGADEPWWAGECVCWSLTDPLDEEPEEKLPKEDYDESTKGRKA